MKIRVNLTIKLIIYLFFYSTWFYSVADLPLPDTPIDRMNWKILVDTATEALRKVSAGAQNKEPEINNDNRDHSWNEMNGVTILNSSSTNK